MTMTMTVTNPPPSTPAWALPEDYVAVPSQVDGIEVYAPAPETEDEGLRTFKCHHCGGAVSYGVAERSLTCPFCGTTQELETAEVGQAAEEFEFTLAAMSRPQRGWGEERREIVCESCGAVVSVAPQILTDSCAFCGSNRVLARAAEGDILRPTALVPFVVDRLAVKVSVAAWLGQGWMHPAELRNAGSLRELAGVYLPYWTFDTEARADWKAEVGTPRTVRYRQGGEWRTRTVIDWRWRSGRVRHPVDDHLVPGTKHVSQALLDKVGPFDLAELVEYDAGFLAGWQAHRYDVQLSQAWEKAKAVVRDGTKRACYQDAGSSHVRNFRMSADFAGEKWRHVLLPVYLSSYRYAEGTYQVMVNGQTGQVAGQKPVDWRKVWLVIAAVFAPGACLGLLGLLTLPLGGVGGGLLALGLVLLAVALVAAFVIFAKARSSEEG